MKTCTKCRLKLDANKFFKDAKSNDGLYSYCKSCKSKADKQKNSGLTPMQIKRQKDITKYGIAVVEVMDELESVDDYANPDKNKFMGYL